MGNHVCPWWLAYSFDNPLRRMVHNGRKILGPYVGNAMTVADLGCGMGYFTVEMARLLSDKGRVIAVDLQKEMLSVAGKRAARAGVAERVVPRLCVQDDLRLEEPLDFALAFWMVHEVPDTKGFFMQVRNAMKETGRLLIAEPLIHVSGREFRRSLDVASSVGFTVEDSPKIFYSRTALLSARE